MSGAAIGWSAALPSAPVIHPLCGPGLLGLRPAPRSQVRFTGRGGGFGGSRCPGGAGASTVGEGLGSVELLGLISRSA
ncbi:hypothetical protein ACPF8X_00870 [Streptomyces sp. G35A]